jgi:hypothetical protein
MSSKNQENQMAQAARQPVEDQQHFIESLAFSIGSVGLIWMLCMQWCTRNYNTKPLDLPLLGQFQMMEVLVYGTTGLAVILSGVHLLYMTFQRLAKKRDDLANGLPQIPRGLSLPLMGHAVSIPEVYRRRVGGWLAAALLFVPSIGYLDLLGQLTQYCRIVPTRVVNKENSEISKGDTLHGADLLLFGVKYPGGEKDKGYYWINHYKPEWIPGGVSGSAGRVKVSAVPGHPLILAVLGVGFVISMGFTFYRAAKKGKVSAAEG